MKFNLEDFMKICVENSNLVKIYAKLWDTLCTDLYNLHYIAIKTFPASEIVSGRSSVHPSACVSGSHWTDFR